MAVFAFDFFNTLDAHPKVRAVARFLAAQGHDIHVVSAISPGLPCDYAGMLKALDVPHMAIHRVDHKPELKVEVLKTIGAQGFWDDVLENVQAARAVGFKTCHVGVEDPTLMLLDIGTAIIWPGLFEPSQKGKQK